jgi:hypothetical protein
MTTNITTTEVRFAKRGVHLPDAPKGQRESDPGAGEITAKMPCGRNNELHATIEGSRSATHILGEIRTV